MSLELYKVVFLRHKIFGVILGGSIITSQVLAINSVTTIKSKGSNPVTVSTLNNVYGGAISSLIWKQREFINNYDHGRQIQSALQVDGFVECNNPTESGSEADGKKSSSTSQVIFEKKNRDSSAMTLQTRMAYWISGNTTTNSCIKGRDSRVVRAQSPHVLQKTVSTGIMGDSQILKFDISYFLQTSEVQQSLIYEFLTGYLNEEFNQFAFVNLKKKLLYNFTSSEQLSLANSGFPLGSFYISSSRRDIYDPVIASTADGKYAMGVYTPKSLITKCNSAAFHGYNLYSFRLPQTGNSTNKWSIAIGENKNSNCTVRNRRDFVVYLAVGSVSEVANKLVKLANQFP